MAAVACQKLLVDRAALAETQSRCGAHRPTVLQQQCDIICSRLASSTGVDIAVVNAVSETMLAGPWTESQRASMIAVLSTRVDAEENCSGSSRKTQRCATIEEYFTASDWAALVSDDNSDSKRMQIICDRMTALEMFCSDEKLLMRAAAIVVILNKEPPYTYIKKQRLAIKLSEALKIADRATRPKWPHIRSYPATPAELSADMRRHVYGEGVQPVNPPSTWTKMQFDAIVGDMCYRNSHAGLKKEKLALAGGAGGPTAADPLPVGDATVCGSTRICVQMQLPDQRDSVFECVIFIDSRHACNDITRQPTSKHMCKWILIRCSSRSRCRRCSRWSG